MLKAQMEKVNNINQQLGSITREMEILRKAQKEMLEIKTL